MRGERERNLERKRVRQERMRENRERR